MPQTSQYMREKKREQRARAVERGLCAMCCKNPAREGLRSCQGCYEYSAQKVKERRAAERKKTRPRGTAKKAA